MFGEKKIIKLIPNRRRRLVRHYWEPILDALIESKKFLMSDCFYELQHLPPIVFALLFNFLQQCVCFYFYFTEGVKNTRNRYVLNSRSQKKSNFSLLFVYKRNKRFEKNYVDRYFEKTFKSVRIFTKLKSLRLKLGLRFDR